jgi:hypothetical protein
MCGFRNTGCGSLPRISSKYLLKANSPVASKASQPSGMPVADFGFNSTRRTQSMSSFRKKGPGALASGLIGAATGLAIVGGAIALLSFPAFAGKDARLAAATSAHP